MHTSITNNLVCLTKKGALLAAKVARGDLMRFMTWWEAWRTRPFDPALLRANDLHIWRLIRQKEDAAATITINRALVTIRAYCAWAKHAGLLTENPVEELKAILASTLIPKSVPEAVNTILRAVRCEKTHASACAMRRCSRC